MFEYTIHKKPQALADNICICLNPHTGTRSIGYTPRFKRYVDGVKEDLTGTPAPSINYPVNVKCVFHLAAERQAGLSDLLQTVDLLLVKYQIVATNVSTIIAGHDGSHCEVDKKHCTEIFIAPIEASEKE